MRASKGNVRGPHRIPVRQKLCTALMLAMVACATPAWAQSSDAPQAYSISAGNLADALDQLSAQAKMQIIYPAELVRGKRAPAVSGQQTWRQALEKLLAGSGLEWSQVNGSTVAIRKAQPSTAKPTSQTNAKSPSEKSNDSEPQELETLIVTGSRIRGGSTPSPVIAIDAEQMRDQGFADLGEVIRSIPQNFNGGQNPGVVTASLTNVDNWNVTGGSGLNLRGLGADASLTLLNGRRMSYGGYAQAVDISAIPMEAVDRMEIVADGASAIYGSDAVAGVANVILKRDFDGVALSARHGNAANGGLTTREYALTAGASWSSGGLLATYKDSSADPIFVNQRRYTDEMLDPRTLYPGTNLRSGLLSAYQQLGDFVELRLDALRTERKQESYAASFLGYYFYEAPKTTVSLVSPSIQFLLPNSWELSIGATHGKDETEINTLLVMDGVEEPFYRDCFCNDLALYEVGAEGPLFTTNGGDVRLAVGGGYRKNGFFDRDHLFESQYGGEESSRFAYAEIDVPLIGPDSSRRGIHRLSFTAAVRGEDYDTFGSVITPKLGLIYGPNKDFTLKASWGKSFKAPTLLQRFMQVQASLYPAEWMGGTDYPPEATVLDLGGGSLDLHAEHARSWTASLAFHPEVLPGLEAELTLFRIEYKDRVAGPIVNGTQALSNPLYAPFVDFSPTPELLEDILSRYELGNATGADYDPDNVIAVVYGQYINITEQKVGGIDLSGSYGFDVGGGRLSIQGSASWLNSSQQTAANQVAYDLAGTLFNPARLNGRIGATWFRDGFTGAVYANYTGGVTNNVTPGVDEKTASFTTVDATLRYFTGARGGAGHGLEFALSIQNLFNREPPTFTTNSLDIARFDSTNYSAIGRFVSLSVSKRW